MLKTGDIIYKVTLEGYDIPCVVVKKYKVGQHLSKIDGTESGGYLLKRAVRADQYLYLGDYLEDCKQTFVNLGLLPYSDEYIYVFDKKDIPEARKQILKNKIARLQSELNYFKRRLNEENNTMTKKFEVGSYAINNKGIGIAGPQSTIYKVVSIENVTSGVAYVILQKKLSNGKKINLWREIRFNNLKDEEFCCYGRRGKKKRLGYGYIAPYDKESV